MGCVAITERHDWGEVLSALSCCDDCVCVCECECECVHLP